MRRLRSIRLLAITGAVVVGLSGITAASTARLQLGAEACNAVKLVSVRGSGDHPGSVDQVSLMGKLGIPISNALSRRAKSSNVDYSRYGLPYPAVQAWKIWRYKRSKNEGRDNLRRFLREEVKRCPHEKLALLGFSQGAHVIGDALSKSGPLRAREFSHIRAVALVADPRFNPKEPYDRGSFRRKLVLGLPHGIFGARPKGDLDGVNGRVANWCSKNDWVCQKPSNPKNGVHSESRYLDSYGREIVNVIGDRLGLTQQTEIFVSPQGKFGSLSIDRSGPRDIVKSEGKPGQREIGSVGKDRFEAFGYTCSKKMNAPAIELHSGTYCKAVFLIDQRTGRLVTFASASSRFYTEGHVRVGTKTRMAERRLHQRARGGCIDAIWIRSRAASLLVLIQGGHLEGSNLHVVGGRVRAIVLESARSSPYYWDCY